MYFLRHFTAFAWLSVVLVLAGCTVASTPSRSPTVTAGLTAVIPGLTSPPTTITSATARPTVVEPTPPPVATATLFLQPTDTPNVKATVPPASTASPTDLPPTNPTATMQPTAMPTIPIDARIPAIDVIVDNRDPGFSTTGTWFTGDGGHSYSQDCAWAPRGVGNIAYVKPALPQTGSYEIFAWWCGDPNYDQSERAHIEVYPTMGRVAPYSVYVNLRENAGQWNSLGTYFLGSNGSLSVDSVLNGNIVADAFRFVYRSPDQLIITPTPIPTRVPWTNHPPTPLEQLTSVDLMARLGVYAWPKMTQQEITFDDCAAFPHTGCGGQRKGWRVELQYQDVTAEYRVSEDYHRVAITPSEALRRRQVLYLSGSLVDRLLSVYRYPDGTWQLLSRNADQTFVSQIPMDSAGPGALAQLTALVEAYGLISIQTPDGVQFRLYGLGSRVELSEEDRGILERLGAELAATAWAAMP